MNIVIFVNKKHLWSVSYCIYFTQEFFLHLRKEYKNKGTGRRHTFFLEECHVKARELELCISLPHFQSDWEEGL
jgi:hypothetical protein